MPHFADSIRNDVGLLGVAEERPSVKMLLMVCGGA